MRKQSFNVAASIKMRKSKTSISPAFHAGTTFNVAASIKMRKLSGEIRLILRLCPELQCGRIYKDAEIWQGSGANYDFSDMLQCGRIYKDAEIGQNVSGLDYTHICVLQCGRIYKDAEIRRVATLAEAEALSFNVAASIKMRKFIVHIGNRCPHAMLQCGRIYKDAEIGKGHRRSYCGRLRFNVAASIKMRKFRNGSP